jgi:P27 family predicted phage terminase small subunit
LARRNKPTHLKLVEGRRDRRPVPLQKGEPLLRENLIDPPEWLSEDQKAGWEYALSHAPCGLLKKLDRTLLSAWVVAESVHKEAAIKLQNSPLVLKTSQGAIIQSPFLGILNRQAVIMKALAAEFGFSPAARTRIVCGPLEEESDPLDKYFERKASRDGKAHI